jgi:hypothetical protein
VEGDASVVLTVADGTGYLLGSTSSDLPGLREAAFLLIYVESTF